MAEWQLAQLNIAHLIAPIDSPTLADFVSELDRINELADNSPGFVWRLESDEGNAIDVDHPFDDSVIVNLSVWNSVESLHNYVYKTAHTDVMKQRKKWFTRADKPYLVLWWVPAGHQPTALEAHQKLIHLRDNGPSSESFTLKQTFPAPGLS